LHEPADVDRLVDALARARDTRGVAGADGA
jgi:hypothetical protein